MTVSWLCHVTPLFHLLEIKPKANTLDKAFLFLIEFKTLDESQLCPQPSPPFVFLINQGRMSADFNGTPSAPFSYWYERKPLSGWTVKEKQGPRDCEMLIEIKHVRKGIGSHAGEEQ